MLKKLKYLFIIPLLAFGIFSFTSTTFADQTSCLTKSFFNEGVGMTCKWNDFGHNECSQSGLSPDPYECASINQDNICAKYGCTWSVDHCTGASITAFTENNFYQYCNMESVPQCYTEMNEDACLQAGCIYTAGEFMEPSSCLPPTPSGMPTLDSGDTSSLLASLGTATQGILDFFVSGATLWFTLAGALILIYIFKRAINLQKVNGATDKNISRKQKRAMQAFARRQEGLRKLRQKY